MWPALPSQCVECSPNSPWLLTSTHAWPPCATTSTSQLIAAASGAAGGAAPFVCSNPAVLWRAAHLCQLTDELARDGNFDECLPQAEEQHVA